MGSVLLMGLCLGRMVLCLGDKKTDPVIEEVVILWGEERGCQQTL